MTRYKGYIAFQIWKFTGENLREFLCTWSRGRSKTYNLLGLFHQLQSVQDAPVHTVLFSFPVAWWFLFLVYHLQSRIIINIICRMNRYWRYIKFKQSLPRTYWTSFVFLVEVVLVYVTFFCRLRAAQSSESCVSNGCVWIWPFRAWRLAEWSCHSHATREFDSSSRHLRVVANTHTFHFFAWFLLGIAHLSALESHMSVLSWQLWILLCL